MTDKTLTAEVWVPAGPVVVSEIFGAALLQLRDQIPAASLPSCDLTDSKATKRDGEQGRLYHVQVSYRPYRDGEPTASVEELVVGMQPTTFNPGDVEDTK